MPQEIRHYVEHGAEQIPQGNWMPADTYAAATRHLIIVCTDAVIIDRAARTMWLARRTNKPAAGLLWHIGGALHRGKDAHQGMSDTFLRETQLRVEPSRFVFVDMARYWWKDRAQEPEEVGSDCLAYTFSVELTQEERVFVAEHLDPNEYDVSFGLKEFSLDALIHERAYTVFPDLYLKIFSTSQK